MDDQLHRSSAQQSSANGAPNSNSHQRCMGCMEMIPSERERCGFCGFPVKGDNPSLYLPVHTMLSETYEVGNLINFRGDTACYIGYDHSQNITIVIREFFPEQLCTRKANGSLSPHMGFEPVFAEYFGKFRSLARSLAKIRGLNGIMSIYDIFEENQTCYTISECYGMTTLKSRVEKEGYLRWEEARPLFVPLLTSLITLHTAGIYHLGISPENILIGTDGKLFLQGFSIEEARRAGSKIQPHLPAEFAAPEQYSTSAAVGAWSDVYAMAATILYAITGVAPEIATKRDPSGNDLSIPSKVAAEIPQHVAMALLNGLQLDISKRTRSISQFRDDLTTPPAVRAMQSDNKKEEEEYLRKEKMPTVVPEPSVAQGKSAKKDSKQNLLIILTLGMMITMIIAIVLIITYNKKDDDDVVDDVSTTSSETIATYQGALFEVPNVAGQNYYTLDNKTLMNDMRVELAGLVYSDKEYGEIITQVPAAAENAPAGSVIKVYISGGKESITIPNLTGLKFKDVEAILKNLGFKVISEDMESQYYEVGTIADIEGLGQSRPRGSTIKIYNSVKPKIQPGQTTTTTAAEPTDSNEDNELY